MHYTLLSNKLSSCRLYHDPLLHVLPMICMHPLFCSFVLWLLRSFAWLFYFSCPSLFYSFVPCLRLDALPVCVCCHFLSSAGVWATESKGDHSGSARQLDSGSRCGALLTSSPPEPSFVTSFSLSVFKENSFSLATRSVISNSSNVLSIFLRERRDLSGEKKLQVKSWNSGGDFVSAENAQKKSEFLFLLNWKIHLKDVLLLKPQRGLHCEALRKQIDSFSFLSTSGAYTSTGEKSLKLPCEWIFIKKRVQTLIHHLLWWKRWSGKDIPGCLMFLRENDKWELWDNNWDNVFLYADGNLVSTTLTYFVFHSFPGLWVMGWCRPQHPQTAWPVTPLQELWHPPVTSEHGGCVSRGGFRWSPRELHHPRSPKEAWPLTTGMHAHVWAELFYALLW